MKKQTDGYNGELLMIDTIRGKNIRDMDCIVCPHNKGAVS
jgi:hypothetical protein